MNREDFNIDEENNELKKLEEISQEFNLLGLDRSAKIMSIIFISICKDFYLGKEIPKEISFKDLYAGYILILDLLKEISRWVPEAEHYRNEIISLMRLN